METTRKQDMQTERQVAAFLDEHLYQDMSTFSSYHRTDTLEEQLSGSDIILSTQDKLLNDAIVDEKVAISRANTYLGTFSLELSFLNKKDKRMEGWLLDEGKATTHYLFGWITNADIPYLEEKKRYDHHQLTKDNIHRLQWAIVSRKSIMSFLEERGWTIEKLARQDNAIRKRGYLLRPHEFINDVSFAFSPQLQEQPINILLKKQTYFSLATHKGTINC